MPGRSLDQPLAQAGLEFRAKIDAKLGAEFHEEFASIGIYELDMDRTGAGVVGQGLL
jgi:hypothetical protein